MGRARHAAVGADHGVGDAVDDELQRGGPRAAPPALHEVVTTQVSVGHGLRHAAVGLEVDGLDVRHSLQVDLVDRALGMVENEAKPETEHKALRSALEM